MLQVSSAAPDHQCTCANASGSMLTDCMLREWLSCSEQLTNAHDGLMKAVRRRHGDHHATYRMVQRIQPNGSPTANNNISSSSDLHMAWHLEASTANTSSCGSHEPARRPYAPHQLVPRLANAKVHDSVITRSTIYEHRHGATDVFHHVHTLPEPLAYLRIVLRVYSTWLNPFLLGSNPTTRPSATA
jgi:hypothetical protein